MKTREKFLSASLIGIIICILSIVTLIYNETSYVNTLKIINNISKDTIKLSPYSQQIKKDQNVYMAGVVYSSQTLSDNIINIPKAIALFRTCEMYQWQEIKDNDKYIYNKVWNRKVINSSKFKEKYRYNPSIMEYPPKVIYANNIFLGNFNISEEIIDKINSINKITQLPYNDNFKIYNGFYFTGNNYDTPEIGDQKIFYSYIPSGIKLSIIAKLSNNKLVNMDAKYGNFVIVREGLVDFKTMIEDYKSINYKNNWLNRGIGIILMFIGINFIMQSAATFQYKLPFWGKLNQQATFLYTILITLSLSTIAISICWVSLHPEFTTLLLILSVLLLISLKKKKKIVISD